MKEQNTAKKELVGRVADEMPDESALYDAAELLKVDPEYLAECMDELSIAGKIIRKRDENDTNKEIGALKVAEGATVVDTTALTIEEVYAVISGMIMNKKLEN